MKKLVSLFLFIFIIVQADAQSKECQYIDYIDSKIRLIDNEVSSKLAADSAGMALIVTLGESVILEKYLGYANIGGQELLSPDHLMGIASMSKQFLGMAALILENRGVLSLDRDVREYLPRLVLGDKRIVVRRLMTHTSGLPEITNNDFFMENISKPHSVKEVVDMALTGEFRGDPGERYIYCNTGYLIMVELIEHISGVSYDEFLEKNIFKPLNMNNTYSPSFSRNANDIVMRYSRDSSGYKRARDVHYSNLIGGGGLITNARDMAKWGMALLNGDNLPGNYARLWKSDSLNNGQLINYGLGMGIGDFNGTQFYYHPGMGEGMNAINLIFPKEKVTITVIRNAFPPKISTNEIALRVAELLFDKTE